MTAGPGSPGGEGPTQAPPHLPAGWIAQWDSNSRKYYYVQLSTGVSQWDVPTDAAPVGGTPASAIEHPYGGPPGTAANGQPELITHPDGSQTVRHPDGRMEPVMPDDAGTRGIGGGNDGPTGDRGLGSMALNALLKQGGNSGHSNSGHSGSGGGNTGLMGQVLSGLGGGSSGHGSSGAHGSTSSSSGAGKIVSGLASAFLKQGSSGSSQPTTYHGGQSAQHQSSGGFGSMIGGGLSHMMGGQSQGHSGQNYGYTNAGQQGGGYSGSAPPTSYQPSGMAHHQASSQHATPAHSAAPSYHAPPQAQSNSYGGHAPQGHGTPSFAPPPGSYDAGGQQHGGYNAAYGQGNHYGSTPGGQHVAGYGGHQAQVPTYGAHQGGGYSGQQYPPPPPGPYPSYGSNSQY